LVRTAVVALAGVVAGAALVMIGTLFGQMTADPRIISAAPGEVAVVDGDTLRLDGVVVRLSDVQGLPRGQSCAAGPDCGSQATAVLASLVRDRRVECRVNGHDTLGRPAGRCDAGGEDVNVALVATGWARASSPVLDAAEMDAKAHRRGIWLSN
jgi:endonuclease YncB( thermonuclease family)